MQLLVMPLDGRRKIGQVGLDPDEFSDVGHCISTVDTKIRRKIILARGDHPFTRRELPTWLLYERGGGRATKRAVEKWLAGREPWSPNEKTDRENYFEAGGNGVAMRILPHCLLGVAEAEFGNVVKNIITNGVCTHGHPRSLVGALAYGYAV